MTIFTRANLQFSVLIKGGTLKEKHLGNLIKVVLFAEPVHRVGKTIDVLKNVESLSLLTLHLTLDLSPSVYFLFTNLKSGSSYQINKYQEL